MALDGVFHQTQISSTSHKTLTNPRLLYDVQATESMVYVVKPNIVNMSSFLLAHLESA